MPALKFELDGKVISATLTIKVVLGNFCIKGVEGPLNGSSLSVSVTATTENFQKLIQFPLEWWDPVKRFIEEKTATISQFRMEFSHDISLPVAQGGVFASMKITQASIEYADTGIVLKIKLQRE